MRYFHNYKKEYGGTQREVVYLLMSRGKTLDEMQELLKCPRASIRGRQSEILNKLSVAKLAEVKQ